MFQCNSAGLLIPKKPKLLGGFGDLLNELDRAVDRLNYVYDGGILPDDDYLNQPEMLTPFPTRKPPILIPW